MKTTIISMMLLICSSGFAQKLKKEILPTDLQIKIAVQAAPVDQRDGAKVYGYNEKGTLVVLREGSNNMVCLAPNINQSGLYAYAYPKSLDPFMARGRELIEQGKRKEKDVLREQEIKSGKLSMPQGQSILYGYFGKDEDLDHSTGEIKNAKRRYVIYVPYATAASIGLPNAPALPGMPWLMDEGSYKAHIMINPENMGHQH